MTLPIPTQRTWAVGDIVTAAEMNANVRDAVNFLVGPPVFRGWQNVAQSIPNATYTDITFDSETVDTYNGHSTSTNTARYTAQVAGWYLVTGMVEYTSNATGRRMADIGVNGSNVNEFESPAVAATSTHAMVQITDFVFLNVADFVTLRTFQSSTAALLTATTATTSSFLDVLWIHS